MHTYMHTEPGQSSMLARTIGLSSRPCPIPAASWCPAEEIVARAYERLGACRGEATFPGGAASSLEVEGRSAGQPRKPALGAGTSKPNGDETIIPLHKSCMVASATALVVHVRS